LPEKCTLPMGLYCKDHVIKGGTNTISLKLENGIGKGIIITSIDITGQILNGCTINLKTTAPGGVGNEYNNLLGWHIANGDMGSVTITCASVADFSGKTKGDITLVYCDDTSSDDADCTAFSHTMEGELLARVE
ncbi:MAG: hypothetical protein KJ968_03135, partial [Nanoarchaeota archaeon]|nr:hypothetical protein [Nanoarchaeota archaeon]